MTDEQDPKAKHDQPSILNDALMLLLTPIITPLIVLLSLLVFLWTVVLPVAITGYLLKWLAQ